MLKFDKKHWKYFLRGIKLKNTTDTPRIVFNYKDKGWGHDLTVTGDRSIEVHKEYSGCLWGNVQKGGILTTVFKGIVVNFLLTSVKWCQDPVDMYYWEGIRLKLSDLSKEECRIIDKIYNTRGTYAGFTK